MKWKERRRKRRGKRKKEEGIGVVGRGDEI